MLTSCNGTPTTASYCPPAVWPDKQTVGWIVTTPTPAYFDTWLDRVVRQQEQIEKHCQP